MSPLRRYLGLAAFYLFLAATLTYGHRTHAAETPAHTEPCLAFSAQAVPVIHSLYENGMAPGVIKYLLLTTDGIEDAGRWLLVQVLRGMELADAFGKPMAEGDALAFAAVLCRRPEVGHLPALGRGQFIPPPTEI